LAAPSIDTMPKLLDAVRVGPIPEQVRCHLYPRRYMHGLRVGCAAVHPMELPPFHRPLAGFVRLDRFLSGGAK
jgi:hypothetical protein